MLVSHKKNIIEYFNKISMSNEIGQDLWHGHNFLFPFFPLLMEHVTQIWHLVAIKKLHVIYYMYIDYVPNLLNPIIRSWLILIWNALCVTKNCHAHSKSFKLEFKIPKRLPPRKKLVIYVVLATHHHFLPKVFDF
jgi:hypothetical protein